MIEVIVTIVFIWIFIGVLEVYGIRRIEGRHIPYTNAWKGPFACEYEEDHDPYKEGFDGIPGSSEEEEEEK